MPLVRKPAGRVPANSPTASETLRLLVSASAEERWAAARSAAQLEGGVSALAAALPAERDSRVREAMLTSLARHGSAQSVDALISLLRSDSAELRTGALDALQIMACDSAEILRRLLSDQDADVRILSCELARSLPNEEATRLLCALLADESEVNVCAAAIEVLAEVGNPDALAALQECSRRFSDSPYIAFAVKMAIERLSSGSARPSRD